jgi:hypothetical protein
MRDQNGRMSIENNSPACAAMYRLVRDFAIKTKEVQLSDQKVNETEAKVDAPRDKLQ